MESQKIYMAGDEGHSSGLYAALTAALQNRGIDPALLLAGNGNGGFFGNNGGFQDIIALIVIAAIFGNGNFGFGGGNGNGYANTERQMLMDAIQRNGIDINALATSLNCSVGQINNGINAVATQICNLSSQVGMSGQQIINSLQMGNSQLASQICSCCCDLKQLVTSQGYENRLSNAQQTTAIERGFSQVGFASAQQTCDLKQNADDNTRAILAKLDAIEDSRKDREIAALTAQNASLTARAERQAELAPLYQGLADVKCKLPETKTVQDPTKYIPVTYDVNVPVGIGRSACGCGYGFGYGFPTYGFTNAF